MSRTTLNLRVFEHQTVRVGEVLCSAEGSAVALTTGQLDALARFNDAHAQRYFSLGYGRITFLSYVGFVQVGRLGIEILPKAGQAKERPEDPPRWQTLLLEMLRVAGGVRLHHPSPAAQRLRRATVFEIVVLQFADELERLLHGGLAKGYRQVESNGHALRGRLLFTEQVRENVARDDRFFVRYASFDTDTMVNRVLATALAVLAHVGLPSQVRARLAACALAFASVQRLGRGSVLFERLHLGRSIGRYREALTLARMILEQRGPELRSGREPVFAMLFDMNLLWERYVAWLCRRAAPRELEVSTQESCGFWRVPGLAARTVRPDIVVRERRTGKVVLVADSKWKLLRERAPSDDDLKQMFVYNELFGAARAALIYPAVLAPERRRGDFVGRGHECETIELGLFAAETGRHEALTEQMRTVFAAVERQPRRVTSS